MKNKNKVAKKTIKKDLRLMNYHDDLIESLKNHDYAVAYLNAALEESLKGDEESRQLFLETLKDVAEAQGSISNLAKKAAVRRESIY